MRCLLISSIVTTLAGPTGAQSLNEGLQLYEAKHFEDAARILYDVMANDPNADYREQAGIYLAEALRRLGFLLPSMFYYTALFEAGPEGEHGGRRRYYLDAVRGLLKLQRELHDPLWVPTLISGERLNPREFGRLGADDIAQINYLVGEVSFHRRQADDSRRFLTNVSPSSPYYVKALYLRALLHIREDQPPAAAELFREILTVVHETESDAELLHVRHLTLLAAGRNAFAMGQLDEAIAHYRSIPRSSRKWLVALYENAWAHFRRGDYDRTLGDLESVTSPYFAHRFVPEVHVIRGTTYFVNCQWDRVRREIAAYRKRFVPMLEKVNRYLADERGAAQVYRDVVAGGDGRFSLEIAREVRRPRRFRDYHYLLDHMSWERRELERIDAWRGDPLAADLALVLDQHHEATEQVAGAWAKRRLTELAAQLQHFQEQINILDFEVADAEARWLERGREILPDRRVRLPRPEIPNDQWQHWSFRGEYWKDELGHIQHAVQSECH